MAVFQDAEAQLRTLAETLPQLVWTTGPDGSPDYFNTRWCEFSGLEPHEIRGTGWISVVHPGEARTVEEEWQSALRTGKPFEAEFRLRGSNGRFQWFLGRSLPLRGSSGRILRWFGTCTDIDAQKKAEEALSRLDAQHRLALEAAEMGTWDYGLASGVISWDERSCALFGIASQELRSLAYEDTLAQIHPDDRPRVSELTAAALDPRSDGRYEAEFRIQDPNGATRWLFARGQAFFVGEGANRKAIRLSGVVSDISRRRAADEAQNLLARELNHRVKNLFAIASGLVSMTARSAMNTNDMAEALRGRLAALARAHELVRPVLGPGVQRADPISIRELVSAIMDPYAFGNDKGRISLIGPKVEVGPNTTTSLALVFHELATNAAKYGALSHPEGRLRIEWAVKDGEAHLHWTEQGGPTLAEPPDFEGFGSLLARKSIAGQLGGTLRYEWKPKGLRVHMDLPRERLSQ
jgi:PAS domain S-box-containing protein